MRFRSKPVEIDAIQFKGGNTVEVVQFIAATGGSHRATTHPFDASQDEIYIQTLEGDMRAVDGDWIIRGTEGEFYPCKDSVFRRKYEAVGDSDEATG